MKNFIFINYVYIAEQTYSIYFSDGKKYCIFNSIDHFKFCNKNEQGYYSTFHMKWLKHTKYKKYGNNHFARFILYPISEVQYKRI